LGSFFTNLSGHPAVGDQQEEAKINRNIFFHLRKEEMEEDSMFYFWRSRSREKRVGWTEFDSLAARTFRLSLCLILSASVTKKKHLDEKKFDLRMMAEILGWAQIGSLTFLTLA
jgi:hypothetical protein